MTVRTGQEPTTGPLYQGIVLRVSEDDCEVFAQGRRSTVRYAKVFPTPRTDRVSPGHLVALAVAPDGTPTVVWRWYDGVIVSEGEQGVVRVWEPSHGEVAARPRRPDASRPVGTRAYLSSGLPGAEWWVAGPAVAAAEGADVELDEVSGFCDVHGLWAQLI
jgi:hypothetical protein